MVYLVKIPKEKLLRSDRHLSRDWSLIMGRGGGGGGGATKLEGGEEKFAPNEKGGGSGKRFTHAGNFNTGA